MTKVHTIIQFLAESAVSTIRYRKKKKYVYPNVFFKILIANKEKREGFKFEKSKNPEKKRTGTSTLQRTTIWKTQENG